MAALALVAMCFVDCNSSAAMVVLCVSVGVSGCAYSGNALTEQDIAPNLAGTLTGITNTIGSATGFLAPALAGAVTMNNVSREATKAVARSAVQMPRLLSSCPPCDASSLVM